MIISPLRVQSGCKTSSCYMGPVHTADRGMSLFTQESGRNTACSHGISVGVQPPNGNDWPDVQATSSNHCFTSLGLQSHLRFEGGTGVCARRVQSYPLRRYDWRCRANSVSSVSRPLTAEPTAVSDSGLGVLWKQTTCPPWRPANPVDPRQTTIRNQGFVRSMGLVELEPLGLPATSWYLNALRMVKLSTIHREKSRYLDVPLPHPS